MSFAEPTPEFDGVRVNPRDVLGHLLLVWPVEYMPHSPTQFTRPDKPSDVIVVDCVDLDENDPDTGQAGFLARKVWWRQAKLIQTLKTLVGNTDPVLARMGKGGASQGYNAPFILVSATSDAVARERAQEWLTRNETFKPSTPGMGSGSDEYVQPVAVPYTSPVAPVSPSAPRQESVLERMARLAREAPRPGGSQGQGDIPF